MTKQYNRHSEKYLRQKLRNDMPKTERILWTRLKGKQLQGHKFRRQYSIGPYVVDFCCPRAKLAIEMDGDSHFTEAATAEDRVREEYIERFGFRILRINNTDVYENLDVVIQRIEEEVRKEPPPAPPW